MNRRVCVLLAWVCLAPLAARAEQIAPRDVWPQATGAMDSGDAAAAAYARQAASQKNQAAAAWADKTATQLDPASPSVAFTKADASADARDWMPALRHAARGYLDVLKGYRAPP